MIERGTVDGQDALLTYVNDAFVPVEKRFATLLIALLDDGRKIVLSMATMFGDKYGTREWNEEKHSRVQGGATGGQFGTGTGPMTARKEKSGRAAAALSPKVKARRESERQQAIAARHLTAQGQAEEEAKKGETALAEAKTSGAKPKKKIATDEDFTKSGVPYSGARSEEFLQAWNEKIGMDPTEFKHVFTGGMEDQVDMRIELNYGEFHVKGNIYDGPEGTPDRKRIGNFTREIRPEKNEAYSAYFEIEKDSRHAGIGKHILGGNVEVYEQLGIDTVKVTANIDVGGYAWAKYGYVPTINAWNSLSGEIERKLDRIREGVGGGSTSSTEADDWDMLSMDQQEETKRRWMRDSRDEFLQHEIESWRDSGQGKEQSKREVSDEFKDKSIPPAWVNEAIDLARERVAFEFEHRQTGAKDIPFSNSEIYDAMEMEDYESKYQDGSDDFEFTWDDDKLDQAKVEPSYGKEMDEALAKEKALNEQTALPGLEQPRHETMSDQMRKYIEIEMNKAAESYASDKEDDIEPPEYLGEQVEEYQEEFWDQKDSSEKLQEAIGYGQADIEIEDEDDEEPIDVTEEERNSHEIDELYDLLRESKPKNLWKIADSSLGKRLLLNSGWSGVLNLKDPESYARFKAYVGRVKKGAA